LLAYLHAHRPSKTIGKNKLQKTKGMAIGHALFPFSFFTDQYPRSAFSPKRILKPIVEPILTQSQLNRSRPQPRNP
jgi:hypothetical protein